MVSASVVYFLALWVFPIRAAISSYVFPPSRILSRDVVVIGGGASGTYAAVRLREDFNTSVLLVEPKAHLGGHVATYLVPETNTTVEYGVQSYMRYGRATDFFKRFGIEITGSTNRRLTSINVNMETGALLTNYIPPTSNETSEAFRRWLTIVEQYEHFLEPGYWDFPLPDDLPADFLTPFDDFAKANQIEAAVPRIMGISGIGAGGISTYLTLFVLQSFGAAITRDLVNGNFFIPVGSNSLLYQRTYELLKADTMLSTTVIEVERSSSGAKIVVENKDGRHLIDAKRILYSPVPTLSHNLKSFDLDEEEVEVFDTWKAKGFWVAILEIPCIPENYSVTYTHAASAPANHLHVNDWPYTLRFDSTGPSGLKLFRALFSSNTTFSADDFKATVEKNIQNLVKAGTFDGTNGCQVTFKTVADHNGVMWGHSAEQLKDGFVQKLYGLQGRKSTFYTGYAWASPYSSSVWAFTDTVLPRLLESLKG